MFQKFRITAQSEYPWTRMFMTNDFQILNTLVNEDIVDEIFILFVCNVYVITEARKPLMCTLPR